MSPRYEERSASQYEEAQREYRDAWMIALFVGCAIIGFGNLIGIGPWWLASTVAVWMIGYGYFIERMVDDADIPSDTKGESIYYLGLLFTFTALVAALITFDWGTPGSDGSGTAGTIRNFGIALLTTIVGLAGRVWFTMSDESPGDIADTTRSRLEETVTLMKESLDRARDDLDIMAHKFRDSSAGLGEMAEIIAEGTRNTAEIIAQGTQQTADMIAEGTRRTADTYDALDAYSVQITGAARSLAREMDRMNAVCDTSTAVLAALQERADGIGQRFEAMQTRLVETESTFDGINRVAGPAAEGISATLRSVQETESAVSALRETLSGVRGSAERAKEALVGIADAVDRHEVLPRWDEAVEQLHAGTRGIRGIGEHAAGMNAEFDGLRASVKAAREGLASVPGAVRGIGEQLGAVGAGLTDSVEPVRGLARDLNAELEAAGRQSAEVAAALEDTRELARRLSADTRSAAGVDSAAERAAAANGRMRQAVAGVRRGMAGLGRGVAGLGRGMARLGTRRRKP